MILRSFTHILHRCWCPLLVISQASLLVAVATSFPRKPVLPAPVPQAQVSQVEGRESRKHNREQVNISSVCPPPSGNRGHVPVGLGINPWRTRGQAARA